MKKTAVAIALLSSLQAAAAEYNNQPYSYIGFATGELSYKESGTLSSGIDFETNPKTTNIFSYSGGYTAIGERAGFYIHNVATLYSTTEGENWSADGQTTNGSNTYSVDGVFQSNQVSSTQNSLEILFGYLIAPGHQIVVGGAYTRSFMDRNSFTNGDQLNAFNFAHLNPSAGAGVDVTGTDAQDSDGVDVSAIDGEGVDENGSDITTPTDSSLDVNELVKAYGVDPEDSIVNYTETFTSAIAEVGYRYDSRFASKALGARFQAGATLGIPLYYDVVNTSRPDLSFESSLEGYDLNAYIGYGWRFTEAVGVLVKANYHYRLRDEIKVDLGYNKELARNVSASIPENTIQYWNVGLNAYWNF